MSRARACKAARWRDTAWNGRVGKRKRAGGGHCRWASHDGNVIEEDEKVLGAGLEAIPHFCRHLLTLDDQLDGVVLRDNALENLVDDRREDSAHNRVDSNQVVSDCVIGFLRLRVGT